MTAPARDPREQKIIDAAKVEHDAVCSCDPKYLMSCARMAQAILAQGSPARRTPFPIVTPETNPS